MQRNNLFKFLLMCVVLFPFMGRAQDMKANYYIPLEKGRMLQFTQYDDKDRENGQNTYTITKVVETSEGKVATVSFEMKNKKGKIVSTSEYDVKLKGGTLYFDVRSMMDERTMMSIKDMEIEATGKGLEFPSDLSVGQTLPDAETVINLKMNGFPMPSMTIRVLNRKVSASEKVTTPVGTFDCYKIDYETEIDYVFNIHVTASEWVAKNVGMVKSESYNKKGKLIGKTILTKME